MSNGEDTSTTDAKRISHAQAAEKIASKVVAIVSSMVREGQISEARIEESFQRIQKLKSKLSALLRL